MTHEESIHSLNGIPLPGGFAEAIRRRGIDRLLPFQERVLRFSGLMKGRSVLLSAPTSSGKTLLAEAALARQLAAGRRAFYLVPTKALAEEKFAAFEAWLGPMGRRVVCATRDRPESDLPIAAGNFDLAVAVYEKMAHALLSAPQALAGTAAVAVDEIQMLGDPERGGTLDLLLTKLKLSPYRVQLVALGPELAEAPAIASWLGCELIADRRRPRELREGILESSTGRFRYRAVNEETEGTEPLAEPAELAGFAEEFATRAPGAVDRFASGILSLAASLARRGEQAIVFAPTRRTSRAWAMALAELEPGLPPARLALARLGDQEKCASREGMERCLAAGIAFHNADLPAGLRSLVERSFNEGEIRIIVSTPTLGLGVNLSARNVLHYPWRVAAGMGARAGTVPLGRSRFANQGGRAGRLGMGEAEGRSILVASTPEEAAQLWNEFILAPPEAIAPPLEGKPAAEIALSLLGGGVKRSAENLAAAFDSTFTASVLAPARAEPLDAALRACAGADLAIREAPGGLWQLTALGEAAAALGLSLPTVALLRAAIESGLPPEGGSADESSFDLYFALGLTVEAARVAAGCVSIPPAGGRGFALLGAECSGPARIALDRRGGPSRAEATALRVAAALEDWKEGIETCEIEERHRLHHGAMVKLGGEFAWLLGGMAAIAAILGRSGETVAGLRLLAERTAAGVAERGLPLVRLRVPLLSRGAIARLVREGIDSIEAIAETERDFLAGLVGQDLAADLEIAARRTGGPPVQAPVQSVTVQTSAPLLELDLQSPGLVRIGDREAILPPLPFELLAALAERPGEVVTRAALYSRLWPEGGPEEQQLDGHRRALLDRLRPLLGKRSSCVAEVVRGIGFRMTLRNGDVRLRRGA